MAALDNLPRDENGNIPLEAAGELPDGTKVGGYIPPENLRNVAQAAAGLELAAEQAQLPQQAVDALREALGPAAVDVDRWRDEGLI